MERMQEAVELSLERDDFLLKPVISYEEKSPLVANLINDIKSFRHAHRLDGESLKEMTEEGLLYVIA